MNMSKAANSIDLPCRSLASVKRKRVLNCTCSVLSARFHSSGSQVVTLSQDGQLTYWEVLDGEELRALQVEKHGAAAAMDIDPRGENITVGTTDSKAKVGVQLCPTPKYKLRSKLSNFSGLSVSTRQLDSSRRRRLWTNNYCGF